MIGRVSFLTIDAHDPARLAAFWCEVLGTQVEESSDEGRFVFLAAANGHILSFQRVPEQKSVKNRLHIDLRPDDQAAEMARLESLGAVRTDIGQGSDKTWVVMADPAGNEFCVLRAFTAEELAEFAAQA